MNNKEKSKNWAIENPIEYNNYCLKNFGVTAEERKKQKDIERYKNRSEKIKCKCGAFIRISGIKRHEKSKKHLELTNKN